MRVILPVKDQRSENSVRRQLENLVSRKIGKDIHTVYTTRKIGPNIWPKESKPPIVYQQCVGYHFKDVRAHCFCAFFRTCHALVMHRRPRRQTNMASSQGNVKGMERKSMWHHGIAVDPGLLGNVTQLVTVWIDNRFETIATILLFWMLGDPHFSFRRSLPFLILSILTKNKKTICTWEVTNISPFMLSFSFLD